MAVTCPAFGQGAIQNPAYRLADASLRGVRRRTRRAPRQFWLKGANTYFSPRGAIIGAQTLCLAKHYLRPTLFLMLSALNVRPLNQPSSPIEPRRSKNLQLIKKFPLTFKSPPLLPALPPPPAPPPPAPPLRGFSVKKSGTPPPKLNCVFPPPPSLFFRALLFFLLRRCLFAPLPHLSLSLRRPPLSPTPLLLWGENLPPPPSHGSPPSSSHQN